MKRIITLLIGLIISVSMIKSQDLIITGVIDGDLSGGLPKLIETYVVNDISDLSIYSIGMAFNGGATTSTRFTFPAVSATAGNFITIANGEAVFNGYMGYDADYYSTNISGNGDDVYTIENGGNIVDMFGELGVDGTGESWDYLDGWAYRVSGTGPDATFIAGNWINGLNALKTYQTNSAATNPFPAKSYSPIAVIDNDPPVWEAGYPNAANVEDVKFDLLAQLDELSKVYYVVLEDGATAPTVGEVIAGTGSAGAAAVVAGSFTAGISETTETIAGLTVETSYDVYVVAEDDEATPNVQGAVSLVEITTVVMPDLLFMVDFANELAPFTQFNVAGATKQWVQSNGYAEMNGFNSGEAEIDWLISPEYDMTDINQAEIAFSAAWRFGINDDTHFCKLMYSENYDGNTDNIATSTWVEIPFALPPQDTWTSIKNIDISAIAGKVYFAFVYNYPDNYRRWRIDNFQVFGFIPAGTDASLSDLLVDGVSVEGFASAKVNYTLELPAGTTTVPTVTYTMTDDNATAVVTPAADLAGDAAARTTTVVVTAQDGTTTQTYAILFNPVIEVATIAELRASVDETRKYKITGEVVLTHQDGFRNKKYVQDATAAIEIDDVLTTNTAPGVITTTYDIGDGIVGLEGKVKDYYGFLQFNPSVDPGAANSKNNVVDVQVLTVSEFKTNFQNYAAELVAIEGVSFPDAGGTFANGKNYKVAVGTDTTVFRSHYYNVINGVEIPKMADIQGIAIWDFNEAKIAPRVASDLSAYSSDATLSDLMVNGTSVEGFSGTTLTYNVTLPIGTTDVPAVTYATNDENATASVTDATDLTGDEAARTTTVVVTAQDGTESTYSIVFTVEVNSVALNSLHAISVYPVPAVDEIVVKGMNNSKTIDIVNILGSKIRTVVVTGDEMRINISDLSEGVYMILSERSSVRFVKR